MNYRIGGRLNDHQMHGIVEALRAVEARIKGAADSGAADKARAESGEILHQTLHNLSGRIVRKKIPAALQQVLSSELSLPPSVVEKRIAVAAAASNPETDPVVNLSTTEPARPFQVMPPLSAEEYAALEESITINGVNVPVIEDQHGVIIDGYNRAEIAARLGIECPRITRTFNSDAERRTAAYESNTARRALNQAQKRGLVRASLTTDPGMSDRQHALRCGVSHPTVAAVRAEMTAQANAETITVRTSGGSFTVPVRTSTVGGGSFTVADGNKRREAALKAAETKRAAQRAEATPAQEPDRAQVDSTGEPDRAQIAVQQAEGELEPATDPAKRSRARRPNPLICPYDGFPESFRMFSTHFEVLMGNPTYKQVEKLEKLANRMIIRIGKVKAEIAQADPTNNPHPQADSGADQ